MWNPGFPYIEACAARLEGYHRSLCLYSHHYRGTEEKPGLVLGLDHGGYCDGRAVRIDPSEVDNVIAYLDARELISYAYVPAYLYVVLEDGRSVRAYNFIVRNDHPQYAGNLTCEQAAHFVRQGHGEKGSAVDYLKNTLDHLAETGIVEEDLQRIYDVALTELP